MLLQCILRTRFHHQLDLPVDLETCVHLKIIPLNEVLANN